MYEFREKINFSLTVLLNSLILIGIIFININAAFITAVFMFFINSYILGSFKKSFIIFIMIIPFLFFRPANEENPKIMTGFILDGNYNYYKFFSEEIYENGRWRSHRNYYSIYYEKYSTEKILSGSRVYIKGYEENNFIICDYVAPAYDKNILSLKNYVSDNIKKNTQDSISYDVIKSSVMGNLSNKDFFRDAGVLHLFAVSGIHVYIIFSILTYIFYFIKIPFYFKNIFKTVFLLFYTVLTGFSPSSVRAVIIIVIMIWLKSSGNSVNPVSICSLTAYLNILLIPYSVKNPGFLMSYGAAFMIYYTSEKNIKPFIKNLLIPVSAFIGVLPFLIIFFGEFNIFGIVLTPVLTPVITFIIIAAFLTGFFSFKPAGIISGFAVHGMLYFLEKAENFTFSFSISSKIPAFTVSVILFILYIHIINKLTFSYKS